MSSGWRTATAAPRATEAYVALGSNLGDRPAHLAHAIRELRSAGTLTGLSSVYETDPVGYADQDPFLNMVVRLETRLSARELLALARSIEERRGRERTFRNAPRTLDIDILLYGDLDVREEGLTIPHPRMAERPFVLVPLLELDPRAREPVTGRGYASMLEGDPAGVRRLYPGERLAEGE